MFFSFLAPSSKAILIFVILLSLIILLEIVIVADLIFHQIYHPTKIHLIYVMLN